MQVRHIKVHGFRGIRVLDWTVDGETVALIGPGDSRKTTILDAIEYALWPRWNLALYDSDFYGGRPVSPIEIDVTVGALPAELCKEEKFGLYLRGWKPQIGLIDEPEDSAEPVLTVRFSVTITDLEPTWTVITNHHPEGKPILFRDRAKLGVARLGSELARDLSWGRASALSRLGDAEGIEDVLAQAYRDARDAVTGEKLGKLVDVANRVAGYALEFGVEPADTFKPALDAATISLPTGAISLHDGMVPVRASGLGTRRLITLGIQRALVKEGAILLIDELEYGLEPHRIRHIVRVLQRRVCSDDGSEATPSSARGQSIFTTHSPSALVELESDELRVVRVIEDVIDIRTPDAGLKGLIRLRPDGLLGRRLVVCEGATEVGLCWGLERYWETLHDNTPLACRGVVFLDGAGGSTAARMALDLADIGYQTACFVDSDCDTNPALDELEQDGVEVIAWAGRMNTEQRVFSDLPWHGVKQALVLAIDEEGSETSVRDSVAHYLGRQSADFSLDLDASRTAGIFESAIRDALARAAHKNKWYKQPHKAELLARIIAECLPGIPDTNLAAMLRHLEDWCYA